MGAFIGFFLFWLAGSLFGPSHYSPPADPLPAIHESSEAGMQ